MAAALSALPVRLPIAEVARPTTVPADHFAVRALASAYRIHTRWRGPVGLEAGYGIDDHLEVGIRLVQLVLAEASDPAGRLGSPRVYGRGRLELGPVELGALLDIELPLEGFRALDLGAFARAHLGPWAALDVAIDGGVRLPDPTQWPAATTVRLGVSPLERLSIAAAARWDSLDLSVAFEPALRAEGQLQLTLGETEDGPLWDLVAFARSPVLVGPEDGPGLEAGLRLVMWVPDSSPPDPFDF